MEVDGFVRRRRMTADTSGGDAAVASASAGAEIQWLGRRFWGVSDGLVGTLTPRIAGEPELTVGHLYASHEANDLSEPDYEGLPQGASTSTHMLAGAVAGIMEHCLMFPIDCVKSKVLFKAFGTLHIAPVESSFIKVKEQQNNEITVVPVHWHYTILNYTGPACRVLQPEPDARYRNVMDALRRIVRTEGIWRPIRGLNATAVGAGPAHALYFACYERLKKVLSDAIHPGANSHLANGTAGCVATLLHDAAMNPSEGSLTGQTDLFDPVDCVRCVWKREGALAFYRSYTTQLTMNVPFQALHFMTYEYLQELLNPQRLYHPSTHVVSGALAGAIAAAATTPLDVCKTLLNTQESLALNSVSQRERRISGLGHAFRTVYRHGGLPAYFKGVQARIIYQMPSTAISWSVYEFFKYFITKHQHEKRRTQRDGEK
ncbi:Mitoferrin-2 Mitochondrial iron transporter 2 [Triplophysa tibetana]|uniref:Mitoferrin-2 Mitochondrial iron transporter 2 n=1 Tax=Triplophysa tibetana TaxID=1572043 RepID=A0A5A9PB36_9TELE|nr:Mitoferrin-2 Mitochondrial iron transporter 2 [Triplophysa tibetana]